MAINPSSGKQGTDKFMRQGHTTTNAFGANVNATAKGAAGASPRELKGNS